MTLQHHQRQDVEHCKHCDHYVPETETRFLKLLSHPRLRSLHFRPRTVYLIIQFSQSHVLQLHFSVDFLAYAFQVRYRASQNI